MPKTSRARRPRRARPAPSPRPVDLLTQVQIATRHPSAALFGALLGGIVPLFARELAHDQLPAAWAAGDRLAWILLAVIAGCAVFSVLTVYKFGLAAFGDPRKAVGFVVAMEGVMLVSRGTTSLLALATLIAVNAIANGCVIALGREATLRRQEADGRRSRTRAQHRARGATPEAGAPASAAVPAPAAVPVARAPVGATSIPVASGHPAPRARTSRPARPQAIAPGVALATRPWGAGETVDAEWA